MLQEFDMLGVPISLYFNKSKEVKAVTGGISSIILYSIMSYILVYLMIRVFEGKSIETSETVVNSDNLFNNYTISPSDGTKFMIAWQLAHHFYEDDTWFTENIEQSLFYQEELKDENNKIDFTSHYYSLENWNESHFSSYTFDTIPDLKYMLWLPSNFSLTGSSFSKIFRNMNLVIKYRPNTFWPLTYEEFLNKVDYLRLNLVIANEYFDPYNKEDPIQTVINDQYYVIFSPDKLTRYSVFVQKNTYEIDTGNLFSEKKAGEFYRASRDK